MKRILMTIAFASFLLGGVFNAQAQERKTIKQNKNIQAKKSAVQKKINEVDIKELPKKARKSLKKYDSKEIKEVQKNKEGYYQVKIQPKAKKQAEYKIYDRNGKELSDKEVKEVEKKMKAKRPEKEEKTPLEKKQMQRVK